MEAKNKSDFPTCVKPGVDPDLDRHQNGKSDPDRHENDAGPHNAHDSKLRLNFNHFIKVRHVF
jgi:hypothetical protein